MMTINGEKTSERDLSAATIQFLGIALKARSAGSIDDNILSYEDPYQYFLSVLNSEKILGAYDERKLDREALKKIIYTAIYSTENKQETNVNYKLRLMRRTYKHKDFVSFFPEFFDALASLRSSTNLPLHTIIYKEESDYAHEVLRKGCLEEKLPILPLHDSFITTVSNFESMTAIMDKTALRLYGKLLSHKKKY